MGVQVSTDRWEWLSLLFWIVPEHIYQISAEPWQCLCFSTTYQNLPSPLVLFCLFVLGGFVWFCLFGVWLVLGGWGAFVCFLSFFFVWLGWFVCIIVFKTRNVHHKVQQNYFCTLWLQLYLKESAQLVSCCSFSFSSGFLTTYPSEGPVLSSTAIELYWQSILHATERCSKLWLVTSAEYKLWKKKLQFYFYDLFTVKKKCS